MRRLLKKNINNLQKVWYILIFTSPSHAAVSLGQQRPMEGHILPTSVMCATLLSWEQKSTQKNKKCSKVQKTNLRESSKLPLSDEMWG